MLSVEEITQHFKDAFAPYECRIKTTDYGEIIWFELLLDEHGAVSLSWDQSPIDLWKSESFLQRAVSHAKRYAIERGFNF